MHQTSLDLTFDQAVTCVDWTTPVRIVRDPAATDELANLWGRLAATYANPFQQFAWTAAAAAAFSSRRNLHIIVLDDGARAAVLPLVRRFHPSGFRLEILSGREMFEPMDAVCPDWPSACSRTCCCRCDVHSL